MEMDLFVSIHKELGEDKYDVVRQQSLTPRTDKTYVNERAFIQASEPCFTNFGCLAGCNC